MFEKTRQSRVSPASPYIPPPRRSGRSPALPYPPGGQNEYSRFFHSTQPAFPGRAMPEKTTLFLADETRSEHFCAVQGELGLTCPIEGWAKRNAAHQNFSEQLFMSLFGHPETMKRRVGWAERQRSPPNNFSRQAVICVSLGLFRVFWSSRERTFRNSCSRPFGTP